MISRNYVAGLMAIFHFACGSANTATRRSTRSAVASERSPDETGSAAKSPQQDKGDLAQPSSPSTGSDIGEGVGGSATQPQFSLTVTKESNDAVSLHWAADAAASYKVLVHEGVRTAAEILENGSVVSISSSDSSGFTLGANSARIVTVFKNLVLFSAFSPTLGTELWMSDGTITQPLFDFNSGAATSEPLVIGHTDDEIFVQVINSNLSLGIVVVRAGEFL